ncbi:hypothetical protein GF382_03770 [Candidatus Falkowbacteria bacterium]|nr:hypothetical protein [Candidatus Falkowbacteria bacterium]
MRTTSFFLVVVFTISQISAADFTPPEDGRHYGVYTNGIYFISKEMVDAVEGSSPKVRTANNGWEDEGMRLVGKYYVWDSGRKFVDAFALSWCVNIGGNRYLPHALEQAEDPGKYVLPGTVVSNGVGGYNFQDRPINK